MIGVPEKPVGKCVGELTMRRGTILLAAIFAVGITTGAEAAKKKAAPAAKPDPAAAAWQNTNMFVADALTPWTPARAAPGAAKGKKK